eukprot:548851-Rhodomonas_salina.1
MRTDHCEIKHKKRIPGTNCTGIAAGVRAREDGRPRPPASAAEGARARAGARPIQMLSSCALYSAIAFLVQIGRPCGLLHLISPSAISHTVASGAGAGS